MVIDLLIYLDVNRDGLDVEVEVDGFIVDLISHKYIFYKYIQEGVKVEFMSSYQVSCDC